MAMEEKRGATLPPHQVAMARFHIRHGGKTGQAFLIHEDPQRVTGSDQNIDSHVKLEAINEEGLRAYKPRGNTNELLKCLSHAIYGYYKCFHT